jgi:hypothetical protein
MVVTSQQSLSTFGKRVRWGFLGLASAPIIGAYLYNQGYQIPFLGCPVLHLTGIPCPTCGMTRSFMAIARGNLPQAIRYHLLGPAVFAIFLVITAHLILELLQNRRIQTFYSSLLGKRSVQLMALLIALSYHTYRLYLLSHSGELYQSMVRSPLGHLLFSQSSIF